MVNVFKGVSTKRIVETILGPNVLNAELVLGKVKLFHDTCFYCLVPLQEHLWCYPEVIINVHQDIRTTFLDFMWECFSEKME